MKRMIVVLFAVLTAAAALAQRPMFDPDEFLDPRATGGRPIFISRLVIGAGSNLNGDGFRPLGNHTGYLHLANSFYWRSVQFDYKRSQLKAEDGEAAVWRYTDAQSEIRDGPNVGFRTSTSVEQTGVATPKSKDTLHAAWYWPVPSGRGIPVMLRSRVTFTSQPIETQRIGDVPSDMPARLSGRERTFALDTDTWFRIARRDVYGSLAVSETKTTGTLADRKERALTYTNRFPALSLDRARILIRPTLTVGGISNRESGSVVNLVSPSIELFRPFARTGTNLHIVYSPQWAPNQTTHEQKTTHQVAIYIDHALFVKRF